MEKKIKIRPTFPEAGLASHPAKQKKKSEYRWRIVKGFNELENLMALILYRVFVW